MADQTLAEPVIHLSGYSIKTSVYCDDCQTSLACWEGELVESWVERGDSSLCIACCAIRARVFDADMWKVLRFLKGEL